MKALLICLSILFLNAQSFCVAAEQRPNILFIMSDDHTTQAIGTYGSRLAPLNPTPTLDRLAREGMRFDRVFCTNSICTPSRACIMTGQYSQRNGVHDLDGKLPPDRQLLPLQMKRAGYLTAMIGKWHLEAEPAPFDYYCVLPGQGKYFDPDFIVRGEKPGQSHVGPAYWSNDCMRMIFVKGGQWFGPEIGEGAVQWRRTCCVRSTNILSK